MSQFDEKMSLFQGSLKDLKVKSEDELLKAVAKGLGPSIYKADAAYVAASDKDEMERLKKNFLIKKLGLSEKDDLDSAIKKVAEKMGTSNNKKHRVVFYYLLVKHFKKEGIYK